MAVTINGTTGVAGVDGSAGTPAIQGGDTNTGMFFPAADTIAFATAGTEDFRIGSSGQLGVGGANYGTSGQVLTSGGASAAPSWADIASRMTLLGTIDTSTGTSASISGLTLTSYKMLFLVLNNVSHNNGTNTSILIGNSTADDISFTNTFASSTNHRGILMIDLSTGIAAFTGANGTTVTMVGASAFAGDSPITTASTSISLAPGAGSFDAGSAPVYGI